ncbi:glycosyltransferase family 2 protein [Candidatus Kuenenbacteria bacterium]|nr:glycosyltransferase family 2 protein [Candidatus Kuenenbacteria bacterium]
MHYLGFGFTDGYGEPKSKVLSQKSKVEELKGYASGCSLVVKKEVLDKIGGYDEEYYMYHDDIELNWRAKLAGYKIVLAPKSVVYHKYEFARSVRMLFYMERNRYLVLFSFYKFRTILLILPALLFMELAMLLYSVAKGWFKTKLRVYGYFLKLRTWRHIIQVRKQVRGFRIKKDKQLIRDYAGKILFQEIENPLLKYIGNPILNLYLKLIKKIIVW